MITPTFLATVVVLSTSGVLTPGPLFLASILKAAKSGTTAGLECATGHAIVEFPLVIGLALGLAAFLDATSLRIIATVGGAVLACFAVLQLNRARQSITLRQTEHSDVTYQRPAVLLGVAFTGLNPFFLLWWLTVGTYLISQAYLAGSIVDVLVMYASHIWMDFAWLGGTAAVANRGGIVLGKWYRLPLVVFGLALLYFAITFIVSGVQ